VSHLYHILIYDRGKQQLFLLLVGLLLGFLTTRINTRLIRAETRFKVMPHVKHGDLHVHHVVLGIVAMITIGIMMFAWHPVSPLVDILAFFFGGATAVVLDEFALVLHLEDVYWLDEGRKSIDAVIMALVFGSLLLLGTSPLGLSDEGIMGFSVGPLWVLSALILVNTLFVGIALLKGKLWQGVIGIFIPVVAWIAAIRLARPGSPWARTYAPDSEKLRVASARAAAWSQRKDRLWDLVGGAPTHRRV